jgi:hypothetical protein
MNILTDLALVILPIPVMWKVQVSREKKAFVLGLFASRHVFVQSPSHFQNQSLITCSVPAVTVIQLVYFSDYFNSLADQTWSNVTPWILTQVVMNMSIITACITSLRVMTELHTNQTSLAVTENMELSVGSEKGTGISKQSVSRSGHSRTKGSEVDNTSIPIPYGHNMDKSSRNMAYIASVKRGAMSKNKPQVRSSQERLREDAITRTLEYSVEEDDHITRSSQSGHSV